MPDAKTTRRAKADLRAGKKASTAAGEFVKTEMEHIRAGKHGARSTKQAIAIGLSEARRAGVPLKAPKRGAAGTRKRKVTKRAKAPSKRRSAAALKALKREPRRAASKRSLSRHARSSARSRGLQTHKK